MPESPQWYLRVGGKLQGPFTLSQLERLRNAGRLLPTSHVSRDGQQWQTALTIPGLFGGPHGTAQVPEAFPVAQPIRSAPINPPRPPPARPPGGGGWRPLRRPARPIEDDDDRDRPRRNNSAMPTVLIVGGCVLLAVVLLCGGAGLVFVVSRASLDADDSLSDVDPLRTDDGSSGGFVSPPADSAPRPAGKKMAVEDVVSSCGPSVCVVRGRLGHGSGFVVAPGVVATNYHVVEPHLNSGLQVSFPSAPGGQGHWTSARFLHGNKNRDLAFLSYSGRQRALSLASDYRFRSGQEIIIIGSPGVGNVDLIQNAVTRGLMSTMLTEGDLTLYQLDASVNPGNSGGPVFDDYGQVVGVVTAKAKKEERLSFCVSVNTLRDELRRARVTVK